MLKTELEILAAIARTHETDDGRMISAYTFQGRLSTATFMGLVSKGRRFVLPRAERMSIAECLRHHRLTAWDFERWEGGTEPVQHGPWKL